MNYVTILDQLTCPFRQEDLPPLDKESTPFPLTAEQQSWRDNGYVVVRNGVPEDLIDAYCERWLDDNLSSGLSSQPRLGGYPYNTPYMDVDELRNLACHPWIATMAEHLIGEPMGVHLNLSGWVSTQRNWHQDGYLNPDHVADHYVAVWVALDDIAMEAGPFEFVPMSHRLFPPIRQNRMIEMLDEHERDMHWPKHSERILTPMFEDMISSRKLQRARFIACKGDVLYWHARLLHRGTVPTNDRLLRKSLIMHYSGIHHRPDMPTAIQLPSGGWYFPIHEDKELLA